MVVVSEKVAGVVASLAVAEVALGQEPLAVVVAMEVQAVMDCRQHSSPSSRSPSAR